MTNRHVVTQAESVTVEFQYSNQWPVVYKDCAIIILDESLDFALIELPENAGFAKGLKIVTEIPEEGLTVFSAGFLGLNNKPSCQLGQGIVSNNSVYDRDLSGTNTAGAIQHTAQIDAGSSGGPLLIKNDNGEYKIIGVNTWKIANRENANFCISAETLTKFLDEHSIVKKNTVQDLETRSKGYAQALKTGYAEILPYISSDYIANVLADHFYELINAVPDSIGDKIVASINDGHPIDGTYRTRIHYVQKNGKT